MDSLHIAFLFFAGIAGGAISTLAGGAAIITFPALLATGISPVLASCSNLVALVPGNLLSGYYDRKQLPPLGRSFAGMVAASVVGALAGATLLMFTPERVFAALIPLLLGFATVLFAYAGRISAWLRARGEASGDGAHNWGAIAAWLLPVSVYGGYFGAGLGVLVLGVLSVGTGGDYRSANVTKNLVVGINSARRGGVLCIERRGGVAAGAGDDGGRADRRPARLAHRARAAERRGALAAGHDRRGAHRRVRLAVLVLKAFE